MIFLPLRTSPVRAIWQDAKLLLLLLQLCPLFLSAQSVQWTSFSDLPDSLRKESKPLLIFIHTDWCKYCALQDHNTFGNEMISQRINEDFYALRLNAESEASVTFLNRVYKGASNGYHQLAEYLGKSGEQLIFPTTIVLSKQFFLEKRWNGFVSVEMLKEYLFK